MAQATIGARYFIRALLKPHENTFSSARIARCRQIDLD